MDTKKMGIPVDVHFCIPSERLDDYHLRWSELIEKFTAAVRMVESLGGDFATLQIRIEEHVCPSGKTIFVMAEKPT